MLIPFTAREITTILSIDPNFTQASTLAKQASHMGAYGTTSEAEVIEAKFQEANRMYDSGRLVEANEKLDEILTIQPYNSKALSWKKRIDGDIAQEYSRRGNVAYDEQDYQRALDNWYNALLIRKDDPALVNKIAQTENLLRKQQVKDAMEEAMNYYNQGRFTESYAVFERITKIQPGDTRVQKYMSQLKDEIAQSYFTAGNNSFNIQKYDSAINYWTNAKKWGADAAHMDRLIKKARNAKEEALRRKKRRKNRLKKRRRLTKSPLKRLPWKATDWASCSPPRPAPCCLRTAIPLPRASAGRPPACRRKPAPLRVRNILKGWTLLTKTIMNAPEKRGLWPNSWTPAIPMPTWACAKWRS